MLTVRWGYIPNEVREAVRPLLIDYLWLVPGWCRTLTVRYDNVHPDGEEVQAQATVSEEYRWAEVTIYASWLEGSPSERRGDVIHELLHIPTGPAAKLHQDTVDRLFEDSEAPKYHETLRDQWLRAYEASVQDLTFSVLRIDPAHLPPAPMFVEDEGDHPLLKASA